MFREPSLEICIEVLHEDYQLMCKLNPSTHFFFLSSYEGTKKFELKLKISWKGNQEHLFSFGICFLFLFFCITPKAISGAHIKQLFKPLLL